MPKIKWYVITGAPCSGKSTLLNELALKGFHIVPEAARVVIDRHNTKGISAQELRKDEGEFQKQLTKIKLEIEEKTPKNRTVFF